MSSSKALDKYVIKLVVNFRIENEISSFTLLIFTIELQSVSFILQSIQFINNQFTVHAVQRTAWPLLPSQV